MIYDVVVVGAGISGLCAANAIKKAGKNCLVVEASDYVGGRIKQVDGFADWPIDLGAEIIHGKGVIYQLAREKNWEFCQVFLPPSIHRKNLDVCHEWFWFNRECKLIASNKPDDDMEKLIHVLNDLASQGNTFSNVSLHQYLVDHHVPMRVIGIADALWGKYCGSQIDLIGTNEAREELALEFDPSFDNEDHCNYRLLQSFRVIIEHLKKSLEILLCWQVKQLDVLGSVTDPKKIVLTNQLGETVEAKRVILTVPLTVLKDRDIQFNPPLPIEKQEAIRRIGMDHATKIFLKFSERFWPSEIKLVICGDSFVPELWIDGGTFRGPDAPWVVVGFLTGDSSRAVEAIDNTETVIHHFLSQLNQMFGDFNDPSPAHRYYLKGLVYKWADSPFIRGGYSYPKLGCLGDKETLAKPIWNCLFFSGEATSYTQDFGTLDAGLVTGKKAAMQALDSLK
ncbi:lysine-specific histone demethylase 1B-like [Schistocerca gregaria]|uniref:lysine-specific histone demethylase 1B-like n=1 Tax=Schistocerca gregaria TaxID=7010 RepID=UPI00211DBE4A|nr:lysine-specific histone demethylase 1B-like [Schistocerca gregaria]